jgi:hypothetical protein
MRLRVNLLASEGSRLRVIPAGEEVDEGQVPESAKRFQYDESGTIDADVSNLPPSGARAARRMSHTAAAHRPGQIAQAQSVT